MAQLSSWSLLGIFLVGLTAVLAIPFLWIYTKAPNPMTPAEARAGIHHKTIHTVVDVRTDAEWNAGHYADAIHIPLQRITRDLPHAIPDRSVSILFYCRTGHRAAIAAKTAQELGYTAVSYLADGSYQDLTPRYRFSTQ